MVKTYVIGRQKFENLNLKVENGKPHLKKVMLK